MKLAILILTFAVCPAWGQIAQSHPEYCGLPSGVNPPLPDVSATIDPDGHAVFYGGRGNSGPGIPLRGGLITQITEVCPLSNGYLAVFGDSGVGVTDVYIVDPAKGSIVDSFVSYYAGISPNQRWIAFVKMYPLHGVEGSDQYLLYDVTKSVAENRPDGNDPTDVGTVIFPPGHENYPGSNIELPKAQRHLGGHRLYWAPDSRAIAFEDRAEEGEGIVLVTLDDQGVPSAFRYSLKPAEICGRDFPSGTSVSWKLARAEWGRDFERSGGLTLGIDAFLGPCVSHVLQLKKGDFKAANTEVNRKPIPTHGIIKDGRVVIPPKEK